MTKITATSFEDLEKQIMDEYNSLSKRLQQTARYLLENPRDIALETVAVIANNAGVTPSTLIRFSNAFGFQGFTEMQRLFKGKLIEGVPDYSERIRLVRQEYGQSDTPSPLQLLDEFSAANIASLEQLSHEIDADTLNKVLDILAAAEATHIVGVRRAFVIASYFAYALRHVDRRAYLIDGIGGMYSEQAQAIGKQDAVIAISFSPYGQETLNVANIALEKEVPLIVISDSPLSPLARHASACLIVQEAQVRSFRSLNSSLCLAQTLSIALAYRLESEKAD
ncbi:MurR/RpiR family transcriptional regulator [Nitrincola nitratireducens]|jgi:DNA-binding MurR/RpiR family transcriptional regulator|uniref:Putative HTH-type transcriptional regulator ybbH n=1 Tax=Nitrincola nitratireducens TaxID=1229521 RepID=W9UX97_9GAMM|nr:MurR/RpiR family transcriptional regulator [Nitrincola nitratireducens]EXJ11858.1 putative HTH-type transcriptional regulator ybbH [Nitrincola nitratireducens]